MAILLESQLLIARGLRNAQRLVRPLGAMEADVPRLAKGKSFVDVGALWDVHGKLAFLAESTRRDSKVRFVQGDLHDDKVMAEVGTHDVVWCAGVLYHCPDPVHTVECLKRITGETLVLSGATVPPIAGSRNGAVYFPTLTDAERRAYDRAYRAIAGNRDAARGGLTNAFDADEGFVNWWWGFSPETMASIVESTGFRVTEVKTNGFHTRVTATQS
jgi:SAM-dependent methyltransferase